MMHLLNLSVRSLIFATLLGFPVCAESTLFPVNDEGYFYPTSEVPLHFPASHGAHPGFAIEWWYLTGHLHASEPGLDRYGFQITFFRSGAGAEVSDSGSPGFSDHGVMLSHLALIDIDHRRFYHQEKLDRLGWNAEAQKGSLSLRHGGWSLHASDYDPQGDPTSLHFFGHIYSDATLDLVFKPEKPRVLFGENGISRKGEAPDAASYYISFTRLAVTGRLEIGGREVSVSGQAWMDHEISSNQLEEGVVGWDWVQMQLFDGSEVMAYRLRREDGSSSPFSFFNRIDSTGRVTSLNSQHFEWIDRATWTSPKTGGSYPISPSIRVQHPDSGQVRHYQLKPLIQAAEIPGDLGGIPYWEGPVDIADEDGRHIGVGFLELTGYVDSLAGRL